MPVPALDPLNPLTHRTWNDRHAVGTQVRWYTNKDRTAFVISRTTHDAWELRSGHYLVRIAGRKRPVNLAFVEAL